MADKIITHQYASLNYDAYKKKIIPSTKQCMTKAKVIEYIYVDESLLGSYANNQLVPISKVVGMSTINLPSKLKYQFQQQGIRDGNNYVTYESSGQSYSPTYLGEAIRSYNGGTSTTINANNNIANIIADILSFTSAPITSLTMKRQPLVADGSSEDRIYVLGNKRFNQYTSVFLDSQYWKDVITPKTINPVSNADAEFLVDINNPSDADNYFSTTNLFPGGPSYVYLKHFGIRILDGTEGSGYYRSFRAEIKNMPLRLEFFSFGVSIGTATIYFAPIISL